MITQMISFTDPQRAFLTKEAQRLGISIAELVRRIIDAHIERNAAPFHPITIVSDQPIIVDGNVIGVGESFERRSGEPGMDMDEPLARDLDQWLTDTGLIPKHRT